MYSKEPTKSRKEFTEVMRIVAKSNINVQSDVMFVPVNSLNQSMRLIATIGPLWKLTT
jgi:hypothetical protein